jgi:LysM repeat protein
MVAYAPTPRRRGRVGRLLAPAALVSLVAAVVVVIVTALGATGVHRTAVRLPRAAVRRVPPYWTVRPGDTYGEIAAKTGVQVAQLEAYNPDVDPLSLVPGERLDLWRYPPRPRPKPPGPLFWTVRAGESYGSIAARTAINIITLEQLNPQLKPATLQPGDRLRLRR